MTGKTPNVNVEINGTTYTFLTTFDGLEPEGEQGSWECILAPLAEGAEPPAIELANYGGDDEMKPWQASFYVPFSNRPGDDGQLEIHSDDHDTAEEAVTVALSRFKDALAAFNSFSL